jgi:osomolarity two-component system, sensor histidine kinase NIK1
MCRSPFLLTEKDVQMPVMGGFEATALIRKYEGENGLKPTPIIALTAHAMVGYRVCSFSSYHTDKRSKNAYWQV